MKEPVNALEYLEMLREKNGKQMQRFNEVYRYFSIKAREKGVPVGNQFELTEEETEGSYKQVKLKRYVRL